MQNGAQKYCWTSKSQCFDDIQEVMSSLRPGEKHPNLSAIPLQVWPRNSRPLINYNDIYIPHSLTRPQQEMFSHGSRQAGRGQGILQQSHSMAGPGPELTLSITEVVGTKHRLNELEDEYGRNVNRQSRNTQQPQNDSKVAKQSSAFDEDFPPL